MKNVLLIGILIIIALSSKAQANVDSEPQFIEPYLYATVEVEDLMHFACNELILSINPKACIGTWRECMIVAMDDRDLMSSEVLDIFANCTPLSIDKK